ncbi:MAG: hypothetical protein IJ634_00990 [Bacteroidales bacterium]|nr:hypothetical protein [Bacteroidales bacterium]
MLLGNIIESFNNNLIAEGRYRMILDGLQVTLLITVCAAWNAPHAAEDTRRQCGVE